MEHDNLRQTFRSCVKASYFNCMKNQQISSKSKIQVQQIGQHQAVDQNTFRIMRNFKPPESNYLVVKLQGKVALQQSGGLFACFGRKQFHASLKNSIFQIHQNDKLKYYFDFAVINSSVKDKSDRFQIKIQTCNKSFQFYPIHHTTPTQWRESIQQSIQNNDGRKYKNQYICKIPQFYKKPYISHQQFSKLAATGDIIFFRSQHSAARVQQLFLNSQYDHVALVLRNKKNQLFLYESSSFEGVGLTEWKYLIQYEWYKSCEKMAWKRLNFKLQSKHFDIIQRFIAKTLGKDFEITFDKIISFQSTIQRSPQDQKAKTYFCSELVARLYKQLGFLDPVVSCTQYYPVTFSDSGSIKFTNPNVSLDKEYIIAF